MVVETDDPAGVFNLRTLRLVAELTRELGAVEDVDPAEVTSLATTFLTFRRDRNGSFSMFAAMTIGIGVDFAIHLAERYRWLAARQGDRLHEALAVTGPAIALNTLVVAAGFGVMTLSRVPANGRLGLFVVASVVTSLLATLVLLPLLFELRKPRPVPPHRG